MCEEEESEPNGPKQEILEEMQRERHELKRSVERKEVNIEELQEQVKSKKTKMEMYDRLIEELQTESDEGGEKDTDEVEKELKKDARQKYDFLEVYDQVHTVKLRTPVLEMALRFAINHNNIHRDDLYEKVKEKYDYSDKLQDNTMQNYCSTYLSYAAERGWLQKAEPQGLYKAGEKLEEGLELDLLLNTGENDE